MTPRVLCALAALALLACAAVLPLASAAGGPCSTNADCDTAAQEICGTVESGVYTCYVAGGAGGDGEPCLEGLLCDNGFRCDNRVEQQYKCVPECADDTACTAAGGSYEVCASSNSGGPFCSAASSVGGAGAACHADDSCSGALVCDKRDTNMYTCTTCDQAGCPSGSDVCTYSGSASSFACAASASSGGLGQACVYDASSQQPKCNDDATLMCDTASTYTCVAKPTCDQDASVCTNGDVCSTTDKSTYQCRAAADVGGAGDACNADSLCDTGFQCVSMQNDGVYSCVSECTTAATDCAAGEVCAYFGSIKTCMSEGLAGADGQGCLSEGGVESCNAGSTCGANHVCEPAPQSNPDSSSSTGSDEGSSGSGEVISSSGADEGSSAGGDDGSSGSDEGSSGSDEGSSGSDEGSSGSDEGSSGSDDTGSSSGSDDTGSSSGSSEPGTSTGSDDTGSSSGSVQPGTSTGGDDSGSSSGSAPGGSTGSESSCPNGCLPGQSCVDGQCVGTVNIPCTPACNTTLGFVCDTRVGQCVAPSGATCINCEGGLCIVSPFPGVLPTCLLPVADSTNCTSDSECPLSSFCRSSLCLPCVGACAELRNPSSAGNGTQLIDLLFQAGLNPSTVNSVAASSVLSGGAIDVPAGALVMIGPGVTGLNTLNLASSSPAAALVTGERIINSLQSSTAGNTVLLNGALATASLTVSPGGSLTISMPSGGEPRLNLSSLSLSGPLNLAGSTGAVITFPTAASGVTLNGGSLSISGNGAGVIGNVGAAPLTLASSNGVPASIVSPVGTTFASSGSILGVGASFVVGGVAALAGQTLEPNFRVPTGGKLSIDTATAAAGHTQTVGDVDLSASVATASFAGRSLLAAGESVLEISGTAGSGANLQLGKLASCPSSAKLRYSVSGFAQAAIDAGITVFNYASSTNAASAPFTCAIEVCGSTGGCVAVDNPKVAAGRRLLATAGGKASWEATKLTISSKTVDPGNSAAAMVAQPIMLLALAFAAIVAMLRM